MSVPDHMNIEQHGKERSVTYIRGQQVTGTIMCVSETHLETIGPLRRKLWGAWAGL
jgi:hypothetical protein